MNRWGIFQCEDDFNAWLRGEGEPLLLQELKTFFNMDFSRTQIAKSIFGIPDHPYFSSEHGRLLLVESAENLNKEHLAKDFLYLFEDLPGLDIKTRVIFWIMPSRPSVEIVEKIQILFRKTIVGSCRPQFHVSTITILKNSDLRLNIECSFGDRIFSNNSLFFLSHCIGTENWFSIKDVSKMLGIPYTTTFNVLKRWNVDCERKKVSMQALKKMIQNIEIKASRDVGIDFSGKFIPAHAKSEEMVFASDLNKLIGKKGYSVRVGIRPKWITVMGPANSGYRCLYDKTDILLFQKINSA
jgi:hypothetical protein